MDKFIISLLFCLCIQTTIMAQEPLHSIKEIESSEHKFLRAFGKFVKKNKNERLKQNFIEQYNLSVSEHETRLNLLYEPNQFEDKNWEGILNELNSLQYLNTVVSSSKSTSFIEISDYKSQIDSIINIAVNDLYNKGETAFQKNDNIYSMEIAYKSMKRVKVMKSNYKDAQSIMDLAVSSGTRNIFFEPVGYDNLGNYIEWGNNNSSASSNYIITKLQNDLSVNNVGGRFVDSKFKADTTIDLKWVSINFSPERNRKYSMERSIEIKENGQEKTVNAIVNYNERYKDVSGQINLVVKDLKTNNIILSQNIFGTTFFSRVDASYTGDKRALTNEDLNVINSTNNFNFNFVNNEGYELTTKMYEDSIHQQILNFIGSFVNWNYLKKN